MKVSIVVEDSAVVVDGVGVVFDFDISSGIRAVQWDGQSGHIEYSDGRPNAAIADFSPFQAIVDGHAVAIAQAEADRIAAQEAAGSTWDYVRSVRNGKLSASDWTVLPDAPLSEIQKSEWLSYRQALRDIPQTYTIPADVVWPDPPE